MAGPELAPGINPTGLLVEETDFAPDFPDYGALPQVGPGSPYAAVSGSVGTDPETGGRDFSDDFLFVSPSDALASVTVSYTASEDGVTVVEILNEDYRNVATASSQAGEGSATFVPELGELYVIRVRASGLPSGETLDYEFQVDVEDAGIFDAWRNAALTDTQFHSDTVTGAQRVFANTFFENVFAGSVGGDDPADLISVGAPTHVGAQVTVRTAGPASTLSLLDSQGNDTGFSIDLPANADGVYALPIESGERFLVSMTPAQDGGVLDYSASFEFLYNGLSVDTVNGQSVFDAGPNGLGAPLLDLGAGKVTVQGAVFNSTDFSDVYRFVAEADGIVVPRMNGAELQVWEGGDFLSSPRPVPGTLLSGGEFEVSSGQEYFLRVDSLPEQQTIISYELTLELADGPSRHQPTPDIWDTVDDFALSGGDAPSDPVVSTAFVGLDADGDRTTTGFLGYTDGAGVIDTGDTLRFVAPADGGFLATIESSATLSALRLLDANAELVAVANASAESLSAEVSGGETYFLQLEADGSEAIAYTARLDAPAPIARDERIANMLPVDAGDTPESALELALSDAGDAIVRGSTGFPADSADFFTFVAPDSGRATFEIRDAYARVELRLLDADGIRLARSFSVDNRDQQLFYDVDAGETYILNLQARSGEPTGRAGPSEGPSPYELRVLLPATDPDPGEADRVNGVEIGDASGARGEAAIVELDGAGDATITGSIGFSEGGTRDTRDYYSFVASEDGSVRLLLSDLLATTFVRMELAPDIAPSAFDDELTELILDVEQGETYVISVFPSGSSATDYRLDIDLAAEDGGFVFIDDPDDGILFDAAVLLDDGTLLAAEDVQLFRTYAGALGRTPDDGGFSWWLDQIERGEHTLDSMVAGFLFSEEFLSFFDDADRPEEIANADFVGHMYLNVFGREPDPGGFAFWTGELESGRRTQAEVIVDMTQSNEFIGQTVDAAIDYLI